MHSTLHVHICCVVNCSSREHFVKILSEFASDDGESVLEFPSTLNSHERYLIHEVWPLQSYLYIDLIPHSHAIYSICTVMIDLIIRRKIVGTVLCCIVYDSRKQ